MVYTDSLVSRLLFLPPIDYSYTFSLLLTTFSNLLIIKYLPIQTNPTPNIGKPLILPNSDPIFNRITYILPIRSHSSLPARLIKHHPSLVIDNSNKGPSTRSYLLTPPIHIHPLRLSSPFTPCQAQSVSQLGAELTKQISLVWVFYDGSRRFMGVLWYLLNPRRRGQRIGWNGFINTHKFVSHLRLPWE
jgi:hypothetical protein